MDEYVYRGIYDEGEVDRIKAFLSDQRKILINEEEKQNDTATILKKYGVLILGIAGIIITLKILKK